MRRKDIVAMVVVISSAVALLGGIFAFQYFQSFLLPPEQVSANDAISIVIQNQNNSASNRSDFIANFVYVKGDGKVYQSDANTNQIGSYLTTGKPPETGASYFSWQVKDQKTNLTYYVNSADGKIITSSSG